MKTNQKIIIYDDACPLCAAYTNAFVQTGLLTKDGRKNFSTVDKEIFSLIDTAKCHNEIPLIDLETKKVWYGIDAMLEILNEKIPCIKTIGNIKPVKWCLVRLYKFISYNRKVIVAVQPKTGQYDCSPDMNIKYRLIFLLTFLCFNSVMLWPLYHKVFSHSFMQSTSFAQLQAAHLLLVGVNILTALTLKKKFALEYLGQINMLALITTLLLMPLYFIKALLPNINSGFINSYLIFTTLFISKDYYRRMRYAKIIAAHKSIVMFNCVSVAIFILYLMW